MKYIFFFLLAVNLVAMTLSIFYRPVSPSSDSTLQVYNPERIILLPPSVDCIEWGLFSTSRAASVKAAIDELDPQVPSKQILSGTLTQFQIHTNPFRNQQTAEREINKLRNMGIASYRILEKGPLLNAVSFGEFTNQASAHDLQKKLDEKGITDIVLSEHTIEHYKFLFFKIDKSVITELETLAEQFPDSKLTHATCERL